MGALGVALHHMGLNLGWVYQFMGNAIGSAVVPLWNLLMWPDANATGAIVAAWGGMVLALTTWLVVCAAEFGEVTVDNLGTLWPSGLLPLFMPFSRLPTRRITTSNPWVRLR